MFAVQEPSRLASRAIYLLPILCWSLTTGHLSASESDKSSASKDTDAAYLLSTATLGNVKEEIMLASNYYAGRGVERDFVQSAHWYQKAADQGNPDAQVQIGYFYKLGIGVPQDSGKGAMWYERAAASGSASGLRNLGVVYLNGSGVKKDIALGVQLMERAAEKGDVHA